MQKWTPEEIQYLRDHTSHMALSDVADALGRTRDSVANACARRRIPVHTFRKKTGRVRSWSEEDLQWLREHAADLSIMCLAKRFDVTYDAMRSVLMRHDIAYELSKTPVSKAEQFKVMGLSERCNRAQIAERTGRPLGTINRLMVRLGLRCYSGRYTQAQVSELTGYTVAQLQRARDAIGQEWTWTGKRYVISDCQYERLMLYFRDPEAALTLVDEEEAA